MSYLKSTFNVCILEMSEDVNITAKDIYQKLVENRFRELTPAQEFGHGFIDIKDIFKTNFEFADSIGDKCIYGGYRYDKKMVPNVLVKKLYLEKLREKKSQGEKLNKVDKKILKEECKAQLIMKAFPKPNLISWIWDLSNYKLYLDTKNIKVIDNFLALFSDAFDNIPLTLFNMGLEEDQLENFLEWLWKKLEKKEKDFEIDDDIILDTGDKTLFKFNGPTLELYLSEIESIKNSKSFKKLSTTMLIDEDAYRISFNSKNLILTVKLVEKIKHESVETAILDNLDRIQQIQEKIKTFVTDFLGGINE